MVRVYVPATIGMLRGLLDDGELKALNGTAFALTPALREAYTSGSTEELEYAALMEAARASLRLIAGEAEAADGEQPDPVRRVVVSADVSDAEHRADLDTAVVRISDAVSLSDIAAVHVDGREAEPAVRAASDVIDAADLGDEDAELAVGDAEDHELAWYDPSEIGFLLELL